MKKRTPKKVTRPLQTAELTQVVGGGVDMNPLYQLHSTVDPIAG